MHRAVGSGVSAVGCARTGYAYRGAQVTARATVHQAGLATLLNLRSGEVPSLIARTSCRPPRGVRGAWWLVEIARE
jgi:hypothetical protein